VFIPITGLSAKTKDRRVDNILKKRGYDVAGCEIFYSPINIWLFFLGILFLVAIPFSWYLIRLAYMLPLYALLYFLVSYLIVAFLNNSFVLTATQLLIINPNFLFRKVISYDLKQISKIKIDSSKWLWLTVIFAHFGKNYVEIASENKTQRFYCTMLEVDAYDENLTEKTMDDFQASLLKHNLSVEFNLEW
jgi:hypothetical protein